MQNLFDSLQDWSYRKVLLFCCFALRPFVAYRQGAHLSKGQRLLVPTILENIDRLPKHIKSLVQENGVYQYSVHPRAYDTLQHADNRHYNLRRLIEGLTDPLYDLVISNDRKKQRTLAVNQLSLRLRIVIDTIADMQERRPTWAETIYFKHVTEQYIIDTANEILIKPNKKFGISSDLYKFAQTLYDTPINEREEVKWHILADYVEESGGGEDIINHLRQAAPHLQGCWALDYLIGRNY